MTKDTPIPSDTNPLSREALGRVAEIGDLYDATTDKFCGISMFRENIPPDSPALSVIDNDRSKITTSITSSLKEKLHILNVSADLKLSVLARLIQLEGAAKYLDHKKTSFKSVECALVYNITTVVEKLNIWHEEVKKRVYVDALTDHRATHVVVQIDWGANCTITVTDQNSEDDEKKEVEGNLMAQVAKLPGLLSAAGGGTGAVWTNEQKEDWKKFSLEIFCDVLLDSSCQNPTTVDGAMEVIRNLPRLIQKSNNGKGKALTYTMLPLSLPVLRKHFGISHSINQVHRNVDETRILKLVRVFDDLSEITQQAYDQFEKMNKHRDCVTVSELEEARTMLRTLEDHEGSLRSDLKKGLEAVRSDKNDAESLTNVFQKRTTAFETFQKFEKIYDTITARIRFTERCKKYGAKCLIPPVDEQIQVARDDDYENVYVLFDGEADRETTQRNHSAFIELTRTHQNDSSTACYVMQLGQSEDARIEHYRNGKLLCNDVATELALRDVAKRIDAARPALRLEPFTVRCPGSFDGDCSREERSWTCFECHETLQFCPDDATLCCICGKSTANQFQFRCRSNAHGSHFMPCSNEILQKVVQHYAALDYKGD